MNGNPPAKSRWRRTAHTTTSGPTATRAAELNAAISRLWQAEATHSKADFNQQVVPIYTALLEQLRKNQTQDTAEQTVIDLLNATTAACHHRWTIRLPMKRPGSDYRKYEIIYTYALVTAMAVGALKKQERPDDPEEVAKTLIPKEGRARLQADPTVWTDWLGFFEQAEVGGLYAVSIRRTAQATPRRHPVRRLHKATQAPLPPPGSGRAMLDTIKQALADGSLSYNQPGDAVQVDRDGRTHLEHPKILKWCAQALELEEDLKTIKGRFSRLKVLKRSNEGKQLYYGQRGKHDRRRIGYVLESPTVLWPGEVPVGQFVIEQVSGTT